MTQTHLVIVNEFGDCNSAGPTAASVKVCCVPGLTIILTSLTPLYISDHKIQGVENETEIQSKHNTDEKAATVDHMRYNL